MLDVSTAFPEWGEHNIGLAGSPYSRPHTTTYHSTGSQCSCWRSLSVRPSDSGIFRCRFQPRHCCSWRHLSKV